MTANPKRLILLLAALVAFGPLSIDMYLPSLPLIADDLGAPEARVQLTIGVFLAGLCLGMLAYGPLSDRFGRRRLLLGGIALYLAASLGCALAGEVEHLLAWRLLQALGGAAASVLTRAIVRDLFPLGDAARVLSLMHLVTMFATLVAPLLGGYLMLLAGWRSLFLLLMAFAGLCLAAVALKIPETHPPQARSHSLAAAFIAYGHLALRPRALGYILCMGSCFAGMFAFITASPFVYIGHFGVSPQGYGWLFGLNIAGIIVATAANARLVGRLGPRRLLFLGALVAATAGAALALLVTLGLGGLPAIVVCVVLYVSVTGMLGANCLASLLAEFPQRAGAAAGLAVATQFGLGTAASALVGSFYDGTPLPMALVMGGCGAGCLLAALFARR
ncbi:Bcr/CflA family drug resistance efflux transporter [Pseudomonas tohonis]|uniref:Bcr/CflA family efflux transporter n=1 Tax=Pseudomonas tohonis TaxID=2725477 RepID=A0A6J4E859_9PSED|nr:Bcr/CflA family multidrug efflux MFS transporter [Pseudomonas tohonis]BCG24701.1 Bcr/CflA family drug resistance efflux transporter [Pseudomonas tohonis]GJN51940.1 Bcr/CflA family drug resistance efflux transporter [Pseudomonas tohonis]